MSTLESICGSEGHSVTSACVVLVFGLCLYVLTCASVFSPDHLPLWYYKC